MQRFYNHGEVVVASRQKFRILSFYFNYLQGVQNIQVSRDFMFSDQSV